MSKITVYPKAYKKFKRCIFTKHSYKNTQDVFLKIHLEIPCLKKKYFATFQIYITAISLPKIFSTCTKPINL